jgi:uncharacterized protein
MKPRLHDPLRLDVAAAAADRAALSGRWPLAALQRLHGAGDGELEVAWSARFEQRPLSGGAAEARLRLEAHARVARECQRCLQPVLLSVDVERTFRFAATEEEAAALDADSEDDVLALSRRFDLQALVEDELLLALPLVPRHECCPQPLPTPQAPAAAATERPFAALAALKKGGRA